MNSTESSSKVNQTFDAAVSLFIQDPHKLTARNIAKKLTTLHSLSTVTTNQFPGFINS